MIWEELLIGSGFWFGLIIILSILFLVSFSVKQFGFIGAIICIFMVIYYNDNLNVGEFKIWGTLLMGVSSTILGFIAVKKD